MNTVNKKAKIVANILDTLPEPESVVLIKMSEFSKYNAIKEAARGLFASLDKTYPGWRKDTLRIDDDSDEANEAWVALAQALRALLGEVK
jgi:hypothetical protein